MQKLIFFCFITLFLFGLSANALPGEPAQRHRVDVLYMDHGPVQPTLRELRGIFPNYGDEIALFWHDFESEDGARFKSKMGIHRHVPLVIWIDGKSTLQVNGRSVTFSGFPTGAGPSFFQGKWKMADLKMALDGLIGSQ